MSQAIPQAIAEASSNPARTPKRVHRTVGVALWLPVAVGLALGCGGREEEASESPDPVPAPAAASPAVPQPATQPNPLRNAYFGDLHVHTKHSFDAFLFGVRGTPDDAYEFAKGNPIHHPSGYDFQLKNGPLDFYAVTDHGIYLGNIEAWTQPGYELPDIEAVRETARIAASDDPQGGFNTLLPWLRTRSQEVRDTFDEGAARSAFADIKAAAERHNEPGRFTTFIGYEYSSSDEGRNLHRNVIFKGSEAPDLPFSTDISSDPEDLWSWMDSLRAEGMESLAIPHNSNKSDGQMFKLETYTGQPLDRAYAETRMRNEPLVEITQVKGTSDTHPMLSPNDEWADFEISNTRVASPLPSRAPGSYVREAWMNGLVLEDTRGFNPFRFGVAGATDTHNAGGTAEEDNFHSKTGLRTGTAQGRNSVPLDEPGPDGEVYGPGEYHLWSAAGFTGVWAEENTRESIYEAFRRKEVFATTGPRIRLRFFAGYDLADDLAYRADMIEKAYATGVPMGADLASRNGDSPRFLVHALRDPDNAPLDRVQIIKGWVENGTVAEKVFDVACSDGLTIDSTTHRCAGNGASVDLSDCSITESAGDNELTALWQDPEFDPGQRAFYYVRALENPTCRWSTWDALRAGVEPRPDIPSTIQERAWSSPIWYRP